MKNKIKMASFLLFWLVMCPFFLWGDGALQKADLVIHGGIVYLLTGSLALGLIETFAHGLIDFAKCEGKIGLNTDQALHIACKIAYVLVVLG